MRLVSHLKVHLFGRKEGGRNREPTIDHEKGIDLLAAQNRLLLILHHGSTPPISAFATETLILLSPSPLSAEKEPTSSGLSLGALIHLLLWPFGETGFLVFMEKGLERENMVYDRDEEHKLPECDVEFNPIAHPLEPPEEDHPAKCPMPDSSLVIEVEGMSKESLADKKLNMGEPSSENEESIPLQMDHKRRHKFEDSSTQTPFRGLQNNFFQVFQQCEDFSP